MLFYVMSVPNLLLFYIKSFVKVKILTIWQRIFSVTMMVGLVLSFTEVLIRPTGYVLDYLFGETQVGNLIRLIFEGNYLVSVWLVFISLYLLHYVLPSENPQLKYHYLKWSNALRNKWGVGGVKEITPDLLELYGNRDNEK